MGGIIIEGRSSVQFKGSILEFEKAIVSLGKLQKELGASGLMIDTVPLPEEGGIRVEMRFKGSISEFEKVVVSLAKLRASVAIDTVPVPDLPKIGTWPTPEKPTASRWTINAHTQIQRMAHT